MPPLYKVALYAETGLYTFTTDFGIEYTCAFRKITANLSPVLGIYDLEVYDFEFYYFDPNPQVRKGKDERISATIINILREFFSNPIRVLTYLCDSGDGRAKERHELFRQWHVNMGEVFNRDELDIGIEGDIAVYGCILTREDFPHRDVLQVELIDNARGIVLEKYGH